MGMNNDEEIIQTCAMKDVRYESMDDFNLIANDILATTTITTNNTIDNHTIHLTISVLFLLAPLTTPLILLKPLATP
jgi:hypothetical protein